MIEEANALIALDDNWGLSILSIGQEFSGVSKFDKLHTKRITDTKLHNDNDKIVTCSTDKFMKLIDLRDNKIALENRHKSELHSVAVSDYIIAAGDQYGSIMFWDMRQASTILNTYSEYHIEEVTALNFSKTHKNHLLSGGSDDHFCYFDLSKTSLEDSMQVMINIEQEIEQVDFVGNSLDRAYALTSVNSIVFIDLINGVKQNTWQYPNNFDDDEDNFIG